MTRQMIDMAASDASGSFQGYLSLPPAGKGLGLVMAQEIFGVNQTLYPGFSEDNGLEDIQASLNALRARAECVGWVGVLGFCLGGEHDDAASAVAANERSMAVLKSELGPH